MRSPTNLFAGPRPFSSAPTSLRTTWCGRLGDVARVLGCPLPPTAARAPAPPDLVAALERTVNLADRSQVWLALATLSGTFPDERAVVDVTRACEFEGGRALWAEVARTATPSSSRSAVRIAVAETIVDVNHTVATDLATGIQRVTHATVRRWLATTSAIPVAWTAELGAPRELTPLERARLGSAEITGPDASLEPAILVPWKSTLIVPELAPEHDRNRRLLALARYSNNRTGVIGFDCVPLTSAETTPEGFPAVFFDNLATVREFDRVAAISGAAAREYEGWRGMLGAVGLPGPAVRAIALPEEAPASTAADLDAARARFVVGDLPLVLVVGSHEPRKNHLAVLHAAELCWREGIGFSLTFVGGRSWASDEFHHTLAALQRAGRPVETVSQLPDWMLWGAYRLARFTVFPSLNEGFGLPVAESLAVGTPVVTTRFGSMREIGERGGALLIDPRVDHEIARAMRQLLDDDGLLANLTAEARTRPLRTWDDYAAEVWDFLTS